MVFEPIPFLGLCRQFGLSQEAPQADARNAGQRERRPVKQQQPDHHLHLPGALAHLAGCQPQPNPCSRRPCEAPLHHRCMCSDRTGFRCRRGEASSLGASKQDKGNIGMLRPCQRLSLIRLLITRRITQPHQSRRAGKKDPITGLINAFSHQPLRHAYVRALNNLFKDPWLYKPNRQQ